jgi:integrase
MITEGKNENARRIIPIGELASSIIRKTIQRNEDANLRTEWIFCSPDGSQGNQSTMRNHWMQLKKERGLPGSVYSLRHTFISLMKNVLPEQTIKDIVGHSVSMDTFGTYGHILDTESKEAAQVIDLTFGADFGANKSTSDGQKG